MKLAYVINLRLPTEKAYGHQISKMCETFSSLGVEVSLLSPERINNISANLFDFYQVKNNFKITIVKGFDFFKARPYLGRWSFYLQGLVFAHRAAKLIADKSTVIYTRNPEVIWLFSRRGFKTVYECHDWFGRNKILSLWFLKNVSKIVTTNRFIGQKFIEAGVSKNKILVAPNGVSLEKFALNLDPTEALAKLNLPPDLQQQLAGQKILLYTGSFRTMGIEKGVGDILEALTQISDPEITFVAVGGNETDLTYYRNLAMELNLEDKVILVEKQTQESLALWQQAASVLLMPFPRKAHYEYFMTPLKMFEYMAARRPIIASNLPSIKEILTEDNAIFCEPGNTSDLAIKINLALNDRELSERVGNQAWADVQNYTWTKRAEKIINFLNHV
ncbi:MAG: glycosyltransferase [Candidatus Pacebacteria bacterium]|nr:glycosyltransferase [Candidatus Paceibacterota bacterium]